MVMAQNCAAIVKVSSARIVWQGITSVWYVDMRAIMTKKIITDHIHPPIPIRGHDWVAYYDGEEEGFTGYGQTEAEAIADLKEWNCE